MKLTQVTLQHIKPTQGTLQHIQVITNQTHDTISCPIQNAHNGHAYYTIPQTKSPSIPNTREEGAPPP